MQYYKFKDKVKTLVGSWFVIHSNYGVWADYKIDKIGNTLFITLKDNGNTQKMLDKVFSNVIKDSNAEVVITPVVNDLWYDDSLKWLYRHYPFWESNWSNCVLVGSNSRILAIQYNWCKKTSYIYSLWVDIIPNYIEINWVKTLTWQYNISDYNRIESEVLVSLSFNKEDNERL